MVKILVAQRSFFIPYIAALCLSAILILVYSKAEIHLFINSLHHPVLDSFFMFVTLMGDGWMAAAATFLLLFVSYKHALIMGISNSIASLTIYILKSTLFDGMVRPAKYFQNIHDIYLVPGLDIHYHGSMPSGHSVTVFCVFLSLTYFANNKSYGLLFVTLALVSAFSRVYLSQHFLADILVGSLFGVFFSISTYIFTNIVVKRFFPSLEGRSLLK